MKLPCRLRLRRKLHVLGKQIKFTMLKSPPLHEQLGYILCSPSLHPSGCDPIPKEHLQPLLNRIDLHIEVPRVDCEKFSGVRLGETSKTIRQRVQTARDIQNKQFANGKAKDIVSNADMRIGEIRKFFSCSPKARA
jgi:predicted ATPase with chaperone activity